MPAAVAVVVRLVSVLRLTPKLDIKSLAAALVSAAALVALAACGGSSGATALPRNAVAPVQAVTATAAPAPAGTAATPSAPVRVVAAMRPPHVSKVPQPVLPRASGVRGRCSRKSRACRSRGSQRGRA
jgi:hypothetical protein